ncbi:hypothetical protein MRX96_013568 [Rhipicephalus microplus]
MESNQDAAANGYATTEETQPNTPGGPEQQQRHTYARNRDECQRTAVDPRTHIRARADSLREERAHTRPKRGASFWALCFRAGHPEEHRPCGGVPST